MNRFNKKEDRLYTVRNIAKEYYGDHLTETELNDLVQELSTIHIDYDNKNAVINVICNWRWNQQTLEEKFVALLGELEQYTKLAGQVAEVRRTNDIGDYYFNGIDLARLSEDDIWSLCKQVCQNNKVIFDESRSRNLIITMYFQAVSDRCEQDFINRKIQKDIETRNTLNKAREYLK